MIIPSPRINNADLDTLAKDAPVVKLADACGIVRRIVAGGGISNRLKTLNRREGHAFVRPGAGNAREFQQAVDVVVVRLNTCAREDGCIKVLNDLDIGSKRNVTTRLARALSGLYELH